jgi:hypothetical protein
VAYLIIHAARTRTLPGLASAGRDPAFSTEVNSRKWLPEYGNHTAGIEVYSAGRIRPPDDHESTARRHLLL